MEKEIYGVCYSTTSQKKKKSTISIILDLGQMYTIINICKVFLRL